MVKYLTEPSAKRIMFSPPGHPVVSRFECFRWLVNVATGMAWIRPGPIPKIMFGVKRFYFLRIGQVHYGMTNRLPRF
jgi:hypothetical protein